MTAALLVVLLAAPAAPSEAAKLFNEGRAAMKAGDLPRACDAFAKSHAAEPALGTLLNLATCHEKQGRFTTAWLRFNDALAWAQRTHEAEREAFAKEHAAALRPKVSWIVLSASTELTVQLDGQAVRVSTTAVSVPVEAGMHTLISDEPGHEQWKATVEVKTAGATVTQAVPAPVPLPSGLKPVELVPFEAPPPTPPPAVSREERGKPLVLPLVAGGAGLAMLSVVGLAWSLGTYQTLQRQRVGSDGAPSVPRADFERLKWVYPLSWVGLVAGLASAGAGTTLLILGRPVSITPGPGSVSIVGAL